MAAPATGDIIYRGASLWQRKAIGGVGLVLTASGGLPSWMDAPIPSVVSAAARDSIAYLMFKKDAALSFGSINGMLFDSFSDQTGVDDPNCIRASYDGTNDLYYNVDGTLIAEYVHSGSFAASHDVADGRAFEVTGTPTLHYCKAYMSKYGSPTGNLVAKLYATSGSVPNAYPTGSALATSDAVDVSTLPTLSTYEYIKFVFPAPYAMSAGTYAIVIENVVVDASNYSVVGWDTSAPRTGNQCYYDTSWHFNNGRDSMIACYDSSDMTILSESVTASASPAKARCNLFVIPTDALTVNTDIKAWATSNNGTHWDQITLAEVADLDSSVDQYSGEVSLTGGSTSMRIKATSHNSKLLKLTAWGLAWY